MSDPTIKLPSCRQDGRCPVCEAAGWITNSPTKGRVSVWRGIPCGCTICSGYACVTEHTRDLLTEALKSLRCLYRANHPTKIGAITACCVLDAGHDEPHKFIEVVEEERDAAIRENVAADQRGWERAISAVRFALADYPHAGLDSEIGAQVERIVAKKTESAIRERDEARATLAEEREAMASISAELVRAQVEAGERADRAEALLRECILDMGRSATCYLRQREALLAKIRETTKVEEP